MKRAALARKRTTPRRSDRVRDASYMLWVKTLPCAARGVPGHPCSEVVEADHAGARPMGRKADDTTCIPLCTQHHRERTDFSGLFRDWTQHRMRTWLNAVIAATQSRRAA